MKIKEIPFFAQPLTRLKRSGPEPLHDAELLAINLGSGNKDGKS